MPTGGQVENHNTDETFLILFIIYAYLPIWPALRSKTPQPAKEFHPFSTHELTYFFYFEKTRRFVVPVIFRCIILLLFVLLAAKES